MVRRSGFYLIKSKFGDLRSSHVKRTVDGREHAGAESDYCKQPARPCLFLSSKAPGVGKSSRVGGSMLERARPNPLSDLRKSTTSELPILKGREKAVDTERTKRRRGTPCYWEMREGERERFEFLESAQRAPLPLSAVKFDWVATLSYRPIICTHSAKNGTARPPLSTTDRSSGAK